MPLTKLVFKPGINRDQTNYANEGGWWECNKIRFLSGFPQKLGGWAKYSVTAYLGVCRTLFNWLAAPNYNYLALGTSSKVYVDNGGTLNDITPLRATYTGASSPQDTDNCLTPSAGSNIVTVNINTHGAVTGDYMTFAGVAAIGSIPATSFNGVQFYVTVVNANQFTITVDTLASTSSPAGGTGITAYFYIPSGNAVASGGTGWGAPPWGGSGTSPTTGWGIAAVSPISNPLRLVYFASRYNGGTNYTDLLFNINNGPIYIWAADPGFTFPTTNAIALSGTAVPAQVGQILYDTYSGILMAFGATPYGASSPYTIEPLLVRWASQDDYTNWDPSTPASSTAGFLTIQTGSTILRAISNLGEILVFTERSVTSVTFVGGDSVFSQKLISSEISLIGPNAVAVVNNALYWMGTDKFFSYNGRVDTLPCTLRQHIFENINWTQSQQFFAAPNERFFEIWWFYCSSESTTIDKYVIYNYAEGPAGIWYYGDCLATTSPVATEGMSRTAWSDSPLRQYPQGASGDDNYLYNHEQGVDAGTLPMTSYITSNNFDLEPDGNKFMLVRRLIPDVSFARSTTASGVSPTVDFTLYPRNFPGSAYMTSNSEGQDFSRSVTQSSGSTVSVEQYTEQVFVRARARQMGVSIESSGVLGVNWQLGAPRLDMREDGTRG
jgi:hypothetical protein